MVILIFCIQPLFVARGRYFTLTWDKFIFFVICMCCVLIATIIIWIVRFLGEPALGPRERLGIADLAILGFAFVTILSAMFSPVRHAVNVWIGLTDPVGRYDGAITQLLYVAAFLITAHWYKPRTLHFIIFGVSASLVALIGILQFFGVDFLKLWPIDNPEYYIENYYNIIFRTTLGNVDFVSTFTCIAIMLSGFLFVKMKSKWRPLWIAASALNFWLMKLAGADSGRVGVLVATLLVLPFIVENLKTLGNTLILGSSWLAAYTLQKLIFDVIIMKSKTFPSLLPFILAVVALIAAGIILSKKGKEPPRDAPVKWKLGLILLALCLAAGIAGVEVIGKRDAERDAYTGGAGVVVGTGVIYELREIMHGRMQDDFMTNRAYIWRNALEAYPRFPVIGTGPDTFPYAFPNEAHGRYAEAYDKAHNEYIQILICQGILGLFCYLAFLGAVVFKAAPKAFRNPLLLPLLAALIGYCAQAFFNISNPIVSQMLWVLAGMLVNKRVRKA